MEGGDWVGDAPNQFYGEYSDLCEDLMKQVGYMTAAVHRLQEGAWVGNSASQFFLEYESLDAGWKHQMENMRIFTERMKQEIDEWINAALQWVDEYGW